MAFGVYIHIPYCLQICRYCDFTKYRHDKIMPPANYVELLRHEIRSRAHDVPLKDLSTVYFGGGTPSLFEPSLILAVIDELANAGFRIMKDAELTIEIDPTTVDQAKLDAYLRMGFNRFSVGVQTFNSEMLANAGRKHTPTDAFQLLELLKKNAVNFSIDLLFGLPGQTLDQVAEDFSRALQFDPPHVSPYCLTVPETHPMARGRASDETQVEMIARIERDLSDAGILRYEISNFARPGFESRHNLLYWNDQPYWGLGVSSHSYFPHLGNWGMRFWNAPAINLYEKEIHASAPVKEFTFSQSLPVASHEILELHQTMTDYCHISLRLESGLDRNALRLKFPEKAVSLIESRVTHLLGEGLLLATNSGWKLSGRGRAISNLVFERLTFLPDELI